MSSLEIITQTEHRTFATMTIRGSDEFVPPDGWSRYRCLLWDHEAALETEEATGLARALVRSGCRYAVCAGRDCSDWHDLIDHVFVEENLDDMDEALESRHVMTSCQDDEGPDDVAFFFVVCTQIDWDRSGDYLVLHVGDGPEREAVNDAVQHHIESNPGLGKPVGTPATKPWWKFW